MTDSQRLSWKRRAPPNLESELGRMEQESQSSPPERWYSGIVATFLSGLFAVLPVVLTAAIVGWVAATIYNYVGPGTAVGESLRSVGLRFVTDQVAALIVGWLIVLVGIWCIGVLVRSKARDFIKRLFDAIPSRIPFVKQVYGTTTQVIGMMNRGEETELTSMSVVWVEVGGAHGAGFLALQATPEAFQFQNRACYAIYVPSAPLPMTGWVMFAPVECVSHVDMSAEQLMQVYLSLGVLTPSVVPDEYHAAPASKNR